MRPAELRTFRESLGLSAKWMATHYKVHLDRVYGWESGRGPVPDGVIEGLTRIDLLIDKTVETMVSAQIAARDVGQLAGQAILLRYCSDDELWQFHPELHPMSSSSYAIVLARVSRELWAHGIGTSMEYMDTKWYLSWLGQRPDNPANREKWATRAMEKQDRHLAKLKKNLVKDLTITVGGLTAGGQAQVSTAA